MTPHSDIAVVGGGLIGACAALELSRQGLAVTLVERATIASGTSARNFSWINASTKTANTAYHRLNAAGVDLYHELAQTFGADEIGLGRTGSLGVSFGDDPVTRQSLGQQAEQLAALGYPAVIMDHADLGELEPNVAFPEGSSGLLCPMDKTLDTAQFARFLNANLRRAGVRILDHTEAQSLELSPNGDICALITSAGRITTPRVLLATGPDTAESLAALTGFDGFRTRFPVRKVPGLLVRTPPVARGMLNHLLHTESGGEFHVFPDFNKGLRLASDVADGALAEDPSVQNQRRLAGDLLARLHAILPASGGPGLIDDCTLSVGIRPYPEDGLSIAGAFPEANGLFLIATHSGVTLAPILGRLMAGLVATGTTPEMLAPFALTRLSGF